MIKPKKSSIKDNCCRRRNTLALFIHQLMAEMYQVQQLENKHALMLVI